MREQNGIPKLFIAIPAFLLGIAVDRLVRCRSRDRQILEGNNSPVKVGGGSLTMWSKNKNWSNSNNKSVYKVDVARITQINLTGVKPQDNAPISLVLSDGWQIDVYVRDINGTAVTDSGVMLSGSESGATTTITVAPILPAAGSQAGFYPKLYDGLSVLDGTKNRSYGVRYKDLSNTTDIPGQSHLSEHMGKISVYDSGASVTNREPLTYLCILGEAEFWLQ